MLSIMVVSYNTREMTLECLRSVFRETRKTAFEVIVLDNASGDGSVVAIEEEFGSRVHLIASPTNLGFSGGNNLAAKDVQGEFLLLLNPDTVVLDGAIDKLFEFALAHPEGGIWGGRTLFADGSLNHGSCWTRQTLWSLFCQALGLSSIFKSSGLFNPEAIGLWVREGIYEVDIVAGCFLLIRRDLWQKLGGFREIFFMYGEDADLCLRARKIGMHPMVTSAATIIHYAGASEKIRADKLVRLLKAKMLLIWEHFPPWSRRLGGWLLMLWPLSRYVVYAILCKVGLSASDKYAVWRQVSARMNEWAIHPDS